MISSFAMLASPQQSRRIDRVIAAPFQNTHNGHHRTSHQPNKDKNGPIKNVDFRNHNFVPLEAASSITLEKYCGPTTESNWVIPGVLLVGAYPASEDDTETFDLITGILKLGIRKFACLQLEYREDVPPHEWRNGKGLRPYFQDVKHIVQNKTIYFPNNSSSIVDIHNLSFDHLPIVDCGVTDDERVLQLCRKLVSDITRGEVIYLHCWGGHGRTGTVVSIMLHIMYGLSATEAMARCQLVHDLRICPVNVGSPQTQTQRDQVIRIVCELQRQYKLERGNDHSNESLAATVRMSRSGSSDHEENNNNNNNNNNNSFNGNRSRNVSDGNIGRLTRNVQSFNSNSGGTLPTFSPSTSLSLPKTNSHKNIPTSGSLLSPMKSSSPIVQDNVMERVPSLGSTIKPLPTLTGGFSPHLVTDFHQTIPRPEPSLSPQKRGPAFHAFREPVNQNDLSDNDPSPASTCQRQSNGGSDSLTGSLTKSPEVEGLSGAANALSMRSPSSEESTAQFKGIDLDRNYAHHNIQPVTLAELLPDPCFETERQISIGSQPTERQLSTASQPMSVSSEISDAQPMHLEGGVPFKRNISCTLTNLDVGDYAVDDNFSTQVRKASATTANNHNFQQKEPLSQPSGVSYTISQVLNVARQVLSGSRSGGSGGNSPTNGSANNSSNNSFSHSLNVTNHNNYNNNYNLNGSSKVSLKTPTPPAGTAPSSKSNRRQL